MIILVVSNILQMNASNKNKPIITRPPPPIPKNPPAINDDLLLIDFSTSSPQNHSFEQLLTTPPPPPPLPPLPLPIESSHSSPQIQRQFSTNLLDSQQFVAKVVSGVTEQLKHDFPRANSASHEYTPPLVRKFTIPYPSSYYNTQRPH